MYIHTGNDAVHESSIIGIFDMDNTTVARSTKGFLARAQKEGRVFGSAVDIPRSFIVAEVNGEERVYLSSVNTATMVK